MDSLDPMQQAEGGSGQPGGRTKKPRNSETVAVGPLVAFVHIPKTAGGTVTTMFSAGHTREAVRNTGNFFTGPEKTENKLTRTPQGWEGWQRRGGRLMVGHVPYSVYRLHLAKEDNLPEDMEIRYMTFLRDPVDRVLSHYYRHFHRRNPERAGQVKVREDGKPQKSRTDSLEQAMVEMRVPQLNNFMTRFLCSEPSLDRLPEGAIEDAKANLGQFAFVGIQGRFDESMALMRRTFELDVAPYENRHVNTNRPSDEETTDEQRALIAEHNQLDIELYDEGVKLFEAALADADADLVTEVDHLRELNAAANEEVDGEIREAREWLDRELPPGAEKPVAVMLEAGEAAGISKRNLKKASRLLGATKLHQGERTWVRPAAGGE